MKTYDEFRIHHSCGCQYYIDNRATDQTELCAYHLEFIVKIKELWEGRKGKENEAKEERSTITTI